MGWAIVVLLGLYCGEVVYVGMGFDSGVDILFGG